jgi:ribosome-associated translation inhibitor RaiA
MKIEVRDRGFKANEGLRNYVGLRLMSVLDRLVQRVDGVTVSLAPVNAPGVGTVKQCRMLARLMPSGGIRVQHTDPVLYAAIDRAAEQLAQCVGLELQRRELGAATDILRAVQELEST